MTGTSGAYKNSNVNYDGDSWSTPQWLFNQIDFEFHFTLDVCASGGNHKCARYYTKDQNSLAQDWSKDICFMNPPFSKTDDFLRKAYLEAKKGATVVALVKADTSTDWWHRWWD